MPVRAVEVTDVLVDGAEAIVMVGDRLTLISGIALELLGFLDVSRTFEEIVDALVEIYGPPDGNAEALVDDALTALAEAGLIVIEPEPKKPLRFDMYFPQADSAAAGSAAPDSPTA
jgi:nucleotide-binding universal stress UspA family protein